MKFNVKFEKYNRQSLLNTTSIVHFLQACLVTKNFSQTSTIHLGISHGQPLWADSVSLQINTTASHQFKPIRIRESLEVNYYV